MSFTHVVTRAYRDSSGTSITSTESPSANSEENYDGTISIASNVEVDWAVTRANLVSMSIFCADVLTFKTNGVGSAGAIVSASINAAGSGYAIGDTGTISGGTAGTYLVTGVNGSGGVTAFTVSVAGSAYAISGTYNATATGGSQAGSGTGFRINLLLIVETFALVAGQNILWTLAQNGLPNLPFTGNVNKLFVTNGTANSLNLKIRALTNQ